MLTEYENLLHEMQHDPRWNRLRRFVRGGFWRNFKVKYPEADEMYSRMLEISRRLQHLDPIGPAAERENGGRAKKASLTTARNELYRGQCNCSYWHGAFGGLYLPHLRNAVYAHLIAADTALEEAADRPAAWVEAQGADFNLDARQELRIANDKLVAYLTPSQGGQLYELDIRAIPLNLLATLTRRPEAYHQKILRAAEQSSGDGHVASIHDRVVFKQPGLEQKLVYDPYPRRSLIDHFFDFDTKLPDLTACRAAEYGDFVHGVYESRIRRNPDRIQIVMKRVGQVNGRPIRVTKALTLAQDSPALEVHYVLEDVPKEFPFRFAVELGFAGLAGNAPDRFFYTAAERNLGVLESQLDLADIELIGLVDGWLGLDVALSLSRRAGIWTFPIQAVSQSEGGFELVHQSTCVVPHWPVQADSKGRWSVDLTLAFDTTAAEAKQHVAVMS
jgi:alpha-amylase